MFLLKSASIAAMLASVAMTYRYVRLRCEWSHALALVVAIAVVLVPGLVFLATSTLMSESVFLAAQLATLLILERWRSRSGAVAAGVAAAATMLIRTAGVALPVGGFAYLCMVRQWRCAAVFAAAVVLVVTPWQAYVIRRAPTMAQSMDHGGGPAFVYENQFWMRWAGDPSTGTITARELPLRVGTNALDVVGRDTVALVLPELLRGGPASGQEVLSVGSVLNRGGMGNSAATLALSTGLFVLMLVGWVRIVRDRLSAAEIVVPLSLAIVVVWPFWSFRFVLPLAPFLLVYLVEGLRAVARPASRMPALVMTVVVGLFLLDHAQYLVAERRSAGVWHVYADDAEAVLAWLAQHPTDGIISTTNPALVYLRTGTPTIAMDSVMYPQAMKARGVRYLVWLQLRAQPPPVEAGVLRFVSPRQLFWVLEL